MYQFKDLLNSSDSDERELAEKIQEMYKGLDLVVNSKSTYLDNALKTENSKQDALIDVIGFCKNIVDDTWKKYDVDNKRHIRR